MPCTCDTAPQIFGTNCNIFGFLLSSQVYFLSDVYRENWCRYISVIGDSKQEKVETEITQWNIPILDY